MSQVENGYPDAPASGAQKWLAILLKLAGGVMLVAFAAIFMPTSWMAANHRWLGLGDFPASPLVDYLTRSVSALYGIHGGLYLVAARDVRRHAEVLRYLAAMNVVFGALMLGIDVHAGMPWYWSLCEGPPVLAFGVLLLALLRSVPGR
jgi:hypothetical protein